MRKIKAFYYVFSKSLTKLSYYSDLLKTGISFSIKYYVVLTLLATLITSIVTSIKVVPQTNVALNKFVSQARTIFPDDLIVTMKNGEWSINKPEPYAIPFPVFKLDDTDSAPAYKNAIVFYKDGTINDLETQSTFMLVNKVNIMYRDQDGLKIYALKDLPDTQFGKNDFNTIVNKLQAFLKFMPILMFLFFITIWTFYYLILTALYILLLSLLVWLISLIFKLHLGYSNSVKIMIHTFTLPLIIQLLILITGINFSLPLWFTVINLIFAIAVLYTLSKENPDASTPDSNPLNQ